jgi:hypothetical protein
MCPGHQARDTCPRPPAERSAEGQEHGSHGHPVGRRGRPPGRSLLRNRGSGPAALRPLSRRDQEEAADVCQEAFVRLLVHARCNGIPETPGAWLRVVAHNLVVSGARRRATADRSLDRLADRGAIGVDGGVVREPRGNDRRVADALAGASADDRVAMVLAAQGFQAREIGAQLWPDRARDAGTFSCRARGRLRTRLTALEAV